MHQLSIQSYYAIRDYGEREGLKLLKECGFDCIDYSFYGWNEENTMLGDDYIERAHNTKRLLDELGLKCNQTHSPYQKLTYESELSMNNTDYVQMLRSIEYAGIIGARNIIVHGFGNPEGPHSRDCFEYNRKYFLMLEETAKRSGVKISIENMITRCFITPELLNEIATSLNPDVFDICLDVGHAFIAKTNPEDFIDRTVKGRLKALHLQDNFGTRDDHLLPYLGFIDWDKVLKSLVKYGYEGDFTLEIDGHVKNLQNIDIAKSAYEMASKTGSYLISRFFQFKKEVQ